MKSPGGELGPPKGHRGFPAAPIRPALATSATASFVNRLFMCRKPSLVVCIPLVAWCMLSIHDPERYARRLNLSKKAATAMYTAASQCGSDNQRTNGGALGKKLADAEQTGQG